jgi:hypothetical protein
MTTAKAIDRAHALLAFINAEDTRQGRPADVEPRTIESLQPLVVEGQIVTAYLDNHCPAEQFAVLTMDESATTTLLPGDRDYTAEDCVTINGETFLVVLLG